MADRRELDTVERAATLVSVRDWLRYGVSRFEAAGLEYGHGTDNAVDEAAFIILEALRLPIESIDPWLDARLLPMERLRVGELIDRRLSTRKPASYLLGKAYIQGRCFHVDERVIVPRSYIGELLARDGLAAVVQRHAVTRVLDLCTGSGCLAVLAADSFPDALVHATDISADALDVARRNVEAWGLEHRIVLRQGDLLSAFAGERYDLIIANPPYVSAEEVAAFGPEHRAEPRQAHFGGADGLDLVRRILAEAPAHLSPGGTLVMEIGTGRSLLEREWPDLPFLWLDTESSRGEVLAITAEQLQPPKAKSRTARKARK